MAKEAQENQISEEVRIEVHFYSTPYLILLRDRDIKGIVLKAHINWLGQTLTHCALRITAGGIDQMAQSTWGGLLLYLTSTVKYQPTVVVDVTQHVDAVEVIEYVIKEFKQPKDNTRVKLGTLLLLMRHRAEEVDETTCTGFIMKCLDMPLSPYALYPDVLCNDLLRRVAT